MTHVPAYYRARRDAERAWRATHPQYVIPGLLDALEGGDDECRVPTLERVASGDGPLGDVVGRTSDVAFSPRAVPPSPVLNSGAGPCRDQWVRPDGSTGLVAAADDCSSASAPISNNRPRPHSPQGSARPGPRRSS